MSSKRYQEYDGDWPGCHHDDPENFDNIECAHCGMTYCEVCCLDCGFCRACPFCDRLIDLTPGTVRVCGNCLHGEIRRDRVWFCDTHDELHYMTTDADTPYMSGHVICTVYNDPREVRWRAQQKYPELCESRPWVSTS